MATKKGEEGDETKVREATAPHSGADSAAEGRVGNIRGYFDVRSEIEERGECSKEDREEEAVAERSLLAFGSRRFIAMGLVWKYKRGSIWYLSYAEHLGRPAKSLRTGNMRIAEVIRAKEENDLLLGRYGIKAGPVKSIAWSEAVLLFMRHKQAGSMRPGTVRTYMLALNAFGAFLGKDLRLSKITPALLEDFVRERRQKGVQDKSIRNDLTTINTLLRWAMKEHYASSNPCESIEKPKIESRPPDNLSEDDYRALHDGIKDPFLREIIDFYILTGCRRQEGLQVRIEDIDFGVRILKIGQAKQRNYRAIPISNELKTVLQKLIKRAGNDGRLIPLTGSALYNRFKRAVAKSGLKRNVRIHSLRHTFGTWLGSHGAAQRNLQDLMGHSTYTTTLKYTHPVSASIRNDMNLLRLPRKKKKP